MDLNCNLSGVQRHTTTGWQKVLRGATVCSFWENVFTSLCVHDPKRQQRTVSVCDGHEYPLPEGEDDILTLLSLLYSLHLCCKLGNPNFTRLPFLTAGVKW